MAFERGVLVSPSGEVPVVDGEVVTAIRPLADRGAGKKAIAREVAVAVNTVRRYLRAAIPAGHQVRPGARRLTETRREEVRALYEGPAGGNAVVVPWPRCRRGLARADTGRADVSLARDSVAPNHRGAGRCGARSERSRWAWLPPSGARLRRY